MDRKSRIVVGGAMPCDWSTPGDAKLAREASRISPELGLAARLNPTMEEMERYPQLSLPAAAEPLAAEHGPERQPHPLLHAYLYLGVAAMVLPQLSTLFWWTVTGSPAHAAGFLNAEFFLLLALALLWPSRLWVPLLILEQVVDLLEPAARLYYFQPGDALLALRYLRLLPASHLAAYTGIVALDVALALLVLRAMLSLFAEKARGLAASLLLGIVVLMGGLDLWAGHLATIMRSPRVYGGDLLGTYIVRLPVAFLAHSVLALHHRATAADTLPLPSTLSMALASLPPGAKPDIVLVVTESWGLATDDRVNQRLLAALQNPPVRARYRIQSGTTRFDGGTTAAETRELCGQSGGRWSNLNFASCWPERLERQGYTTLAVHGFAPAIYSREPWYREFGFSRSVFLAELARDRTPMCGGVFPGACDAGVATWLGETLRDGGERRSPLFVHWVTLNSHLPVPLTAAQGTQEDCAATGFDGDQSLCSWFRLVLRSERSVAGLALTPGLRPTVFVVVGDHAPPFLRGSARDRFSQTDVPFVILTPRSATEQADQVTYRSVVEPADVPARR